MSVIRIVDAMMNGTRIKKLARKMFSSINSLNVGSTPRFNVYAIGLPTIALNRPLAKSEEII